MGRLTKAELTTAIDILSHPQSGDESDIFAAYTTARVAMKELKQYKDLEEQGRLMELPCAVGDTIYEVHDGAIRTNRLGSKWRITRYLEEGFFGELVFTTREEAEAKLKELGVQNG